MGLASGALGLKAIEGAYHYRGPGARGAALAPGTHSPLGSSSPIDRIAWHFCPARETDNAR